MSKLAKLCSLSLAAAVVAFGCGDSPNPLSPDSPTGASLSAAVRTPVTATWTNLGGPDLPPPPTVTGGAAHFWNDVLTGPIVGDLVGTVDAVVDLNAGLAAGKGPLAGTMDFNLAGGGFEGRFAGIFDFSIGLSTGHFSGQGTGAYAGQSINGTYTNAPGGFVFAMEGYIVSPRP